MNLSNITINEVEQVGDLKGFLLLQVPSKLHYCSTTISPDSILSLCESMLVLNSLTAMGALQEISSRHLSDVLTIRPHSGKDGNFLIGVLTSKKVSSPDVFKTIQDTLEI